MITIVISAIKIQKLFKIRQKGQPKEYGLIKQVSEGDEEHAGSKFYFKFKRILFGMW